MHAKNTVFIWFFCMCTMQTYETESYTRCKRKKRFHITVQCTCTVRCNERPRERLSLTCCATCVFSSAHLRSQLYETVSYNCSTHTHAVHRESSHVCDSANTHTQKTHINIDFFEPPLEMTCKKPLFYMTFLPTTPHFS